MKGNLPLINFKFTHATKIGLLLTSFVILFKVVLYLDAYMGFILNRGKLTATPLGQTISLHNWHYKKKDTHLPLDLRLQEHQGLDQAR